MHSVVAVSICFAATFECFDAETSFLCVYTIGWKSGEVSVSLAIADLAQLLTAFLDFSVQ